MRILADRHELQDRFLRHRIFFSRLRKRASFRSRSAKVLLSFFNHGSQISFKRKVFRHDLQLKQRTGRSHSFWDRLEHALCAVVLCERRAPCLRRLDPLLTGLSSSHTCNELLASSQPAITFESNPSHLCRQGPRSARVDHGALHRRTAHRNSPRILCGSGCSAPCKLGQVPAPAGSAKRSQVA
jgi:hypothetical protein